MEKIHELVKALSTELKGEFRSGLASMENKLETMQISIDTTPQSLHSLHSWRSGVDTQVSDLTASVQALCKQMDCVVIGVVLSALGAPPGSSPSMPPPPATSTTTLDANGSASLGHNTGKIGHGSLHHHRGLMGEHALVPLSSPVIPTHRPWPCLLFQFLNYSSLFVLHLYCLLLNFRILMERMPNCGRKRLRSTSICSQSSLLLMWSMQRCISLGMLPCACGRSVACPKLGTTV
jgi:hypothetical protein